MIISASRRTDIPAFFSQWFMNRIREGFCMVPNPFNAKQVSLVPLSPEQVDAIVFWTKNAGPMLGHIGVLENMGYRFYFQFTLNDYPRPLEPNVPPLEDRLGAFERLSEAIGPRRVVWRYDPIIISNVTDYDYHRSAFTRLCERLASHTRRVVVSIVDMYKKTERNLKAVVSQGFEFPQDPVAEREMDDLLADLATTAKRFSLEILTCAEKRDYTALGIPPGKCIDGDLIENLWGMHGSLKKDSGQRKECGCVVSKDIGMTDSCPHGCPYCYATRSCELACSRYEKHDPNSTALLCNPAPPPGKTWGEQTLLFR